MSEVRLRRPRRRVSPFLVLPFFSALVLVLGWSVLWVLARQQSLGAMDQWLAAEAAHGRQWTCPYRKVGGFPFRITLACREPSFAGTVDGAKAEGHVSGFKAVSWLYEPSSVDVAVQGPLAYTSENEKADFTLKWAELHVTLRGLIGGMKRVAVDVEQPDLALSDGDGGSAEHAELHVGPASGRPVDDLADAVELLVAGASVPALDAATGDAVPLDTEIKGIITHALGDLPDFGPATVDRWRLSGGKVEVSRAMLNKGDLKAEASGAVGLDDQHRLAGRLQAGLSGFGPLAEKLGIPLRAVEVGGLMAKLLNGSPLGAPADAGDAGNVALPIILAGGNLSIGPVRTPVRLRPLY